MTAVRLDRFSTSGAVPTRWRVRSQRLRTAAAHVVRVPTMTAVRLLSRRGADEVANLPT
jgi:hypothetical protein